MFIPMELLSPMTTRADSGKGPGASRAGPDANKDRPQFGKMFEDELQRHDMKMLKQRDGPEKDAVKENTANDAKPPGIQEKPKPPDDKGETQTTGAEGLLWQAMGTQKLKQEQEVVFILEGEESVNPEPRDLSPQMREGSQWQPEPDTEVKAQTGTAESEMKTGTEPAQSENIINPDGAQRTVHADDSETAQFKDILAAKTETATKTENEDVAGDNTARKPDIEPIDSQTGKETVKETGKETGKATDSGFIKEGNPSPLENENESVNAKAQGQEKAVVIKADENVQARPAITETPQNGKITEISGNDAAGTEASRIAKAETPQSGKDGTGTTHDDSAKNETAGTDAVKAVKKTQADEGTGAIKTEPVLSVETTAIPLSEGIKQEQFKGAEQMTQAALTRAVKPENLFDEMVKKVETAYDQTKSTMTIELDPKHLGKVALEVALDSAGVHVKINAEDSGVRGMINSQLTALIESLENKGITVSEVEVVFAGANFDNLSQQDSSRHDRGTDGKATKNAGNAKDSVEYYTTITDLMNFYMESGISTVEYRA